MTFIAIGEEEGARLVIGLPHYMDLNPNYLN